MSDDNVIPFPLPAPAPPVGEGLLMMIEALLFAAGEPVTITELVAAIGIVDKDDVRTALHELAQASVGRGIRVVKVSGGWQMRTDPAFADAVLRLRGGKPLRMSPAALETMAVIAYRQPATRTEVDEIRGVASGGVLKTLLDRGYLRVVGRRDEPGRPLEYGTTPLFLEMFELDSLAALPTLAEREELANTEPPAALPVNPLAELVGSGPMDLLNDPAAAAEPVPANDEPANDAPGGGDASDDEPLPDEP